MFKYNYVADLFNRLIKNADFPMQLELHPGSHCGGMNCRYCYGKNQKLNKGILEICDYEKLLDDVNGKTNLIDISGIASDPLSYRFIYELIKLIKKKKINLGIHSKGYLLDEKISELINSGETDGDFITLSIDSSNAPNYNLLHGFNKKDNAFDKVVDKLRFLNNEKIKRNSNLRINIGYLLFQENSSNEEIEKFIEIFEPFANMLRFSIPQVPNVADPIGFIPKNQIEKTLIRLKKFEKNNVIVLKFDYSEHNHSFDTCWSQRFNITVDKAGYVFPCPQVALSNYNHISYGNIKKQTIWEIWNSQKRQSILKMDVDREMKCRVCDRKDENINIELEKILKPDKYI